MTELAPESFPEACRRFSDFLQRNGYPGRLRWVTQQEVVWNGRELLVMRRPRLSTWNEICSAYAAGIDKKLGVCLHGFGTWDDSTIATMIVPKDADAAQRALIAREGLKMSADVRMFPSRGVGNILAWSFCSRRYRPLSTQFWQSCCEYS